MGLVTKETVSIIMIALAVLLILSGISIVVLSAMVNRRNVKIIALMGGLFDSAAGLIIIAFSVIAFLE